MKGSAQQAHLLVVHIYSRNSRVVHDSRTRGLGKREDSVIAIHKM